MDSEDVNPAAPIPHAPSQPDDSPTRPKWFVLAWWILGGVYLLISASLAYRYVSAETYFRSIEPGVRPMKGFAPWAIHATSMAAICIFAGSLFATVLAAVSTKRRLQLRWFAVLLIVAGVAGLLRANHPVLRTGEYLLTATEQEAAADRWLFGVGAFLCAGGLCVAFGCMDALIRSKTHKY